MDVRSIEKIRLNSTSHSVRAAQAVLQYGVGAMVDFPSQTLMTAAPEYWEARIVTEFHMPVFPNGIFARNAADFNRFRNGLRSITVRRRKGIKLTIPI